MIDLSSGCERSYVVLETIFCFLRGFFTVGKRDEPCYCVRKVMLCLTKSRVNCAVVSRSPAVLTVAASQQVSVRVIQGFSIQQLTSRKKKREEINSCVVVTGTDTT